MNTFDSERVHAALHGTIFHGKVHHFTSLDSTNARALAGAEAGAEAGQVYIADEQSAGRGRGGHGWHSEADCGLYLTALLHPPVRGDQLLQLSLMTGLAASTAIHAVTGLRIDLRWPNDLLSSPALGRSRKLGGILTESAVSADGAVRYVAVGIGINLNQSAFPPELQAVATSLRLVLGARVSREDIAVALLSRLDVELRQIEQAGAGNTLLARFAAASSWVTGKRVHVDEDGGYTGVTAGLTQVGLLRVQDDDGRERVVRHGGVRELQ